LVPSDVGVLGSRGRTSERVGDHPGKVVVAPRHHADDVDRVDGGNERCGRHRILERTSSGGRDEVERLACLVDGSGPVVADLPHPDDHGKAVLVDAGHEACRGTDDVTIKRPTSVPASS
jgi:hypothetical protein